MTIHFLVDNQTVKRTDENNVVADSRNYLYAEFSFSEEWNGIKTAVFRKSGEVYNQILDENNRCLVPWEVLNSGVLEVSCFCGDRITAGTAKVNIERSGYELGQAVENPSPDVYSQLLEKVEKAAGGHKYTTEEQVIGTWIDGKPLYEKTVSFVMQDTEGIIPEFDACGVENVTSVEGYIRHYDEDIPTDFENFVFSGGFYVSAEDYLKLSYYYQAEPTELSPNGIYYECADCYSGAVCTVTVRYTKFSDMTVSDGE